MSELSNEKQTKLLKAMISILDFTTQDAYDVFTSELEIEQGELEKMSAKEIELKLIDRGCEIDECIKELLELLK